MVRPQTPLRRTAATTLSRSREKLDQAMQACREDLYFFERVVEIKACPTARLHAESFVKRLGAMMARSDCHAVAVEQLSDIMWMGPFEREANNARFLFGSRAEKA